MASKASSKVGGNSYARQAGKVVNALIRNGDANAFTTLSGIADEAISSQEPRNIQNTLTVLEAMGHIEVTRDESGIVSYRLTPSGLTLFESLGAK